MSASGVARRVRRWARRVVPGTDARLLGLRASQSGQSALEYVGLVVVVAAIIGALVGTGIGPTLAEGLSTQVCRITGGGDCGGGDGTQAQDGAGGQDAGGSDGTGGEQNASDDGDTPKSQEQLDYEKALKELQDAQAAEQSDSDKAKEAAKELAKILAEELGITDALDCITKGDMGACTETLVNILLSLVGGAVGKLAAKYGAPWKWKKAYELIQKLKKHGGDLYDGLTGLLKNRKRVKDAEKALDDARKKYDPEKQKKPGEKPGEKNPDEKKPDDTPTNCPVAHSFPPGTRVLLAGGWSIPIESVRLGDQVVATDPTSGLTTVRPVVRTFVTHDDKDFTRLGTTAGPVTATDTHPFWLTGERRWAEAGDIGTGATLRLPDGGSLQVTSVTRYAQRQTTYDLAVDGLHSYYVGIGSAHALVHNNNTCKEFETDPSVKGPAAGKKLKPPHDRHTVAGAKHGQVKEKNTVILKGREAEVEADIKGIAEGKGKLVDNGSAYEINGRKYGVEENGRTYPISGKGLVDMNRTEYAALKEIARAGGDPSKVKAFQFDPKFKNNPAAVEKAKQVYDGTYQ
ncbi:polymorphic toxin-type HINT domain-containing protein [Streptomyces sp. NPDC091376]|uniref:polymorphic toxin-type HINT domain-containing protein n=1 Tax=Streptomyces sp. NPDC091376 TaxID=3365994 RepID=UPI003822D672